MRFSRWFMALLIVATSVGLVPFQQQTIWAQDTPGDAPMFRGNAARTGEMPGPGPVVEPDNPSPRLLWRFATDGDVSSSPAVVDGVVYVGSDARYLFALDAATGAERWRFQTAGRVESSPAVVNGTVFAGSGRQLYAVDASSGAARWRFQTYGPVLSSPAVVDGVVFFGGSSDMDLYAVEAASGAALWRFRTLGSISSPAVVDGVVYVGSSYGNVHAIDTASGVGLWSFQTGHWPRSSPAVVDGVVYISSGHLFAINAASGTERWHFPIDGGVSSSPAFADGVVYVGGFDGHLYAIEASSGTERWRFQTGGSVESSPAVVGGVVYVGSNDGHLYAIEAASGIEHWRFETGGGISSSPAVVDGVVFVGSNDGFVYAIGDPDAPPIALVRTERRTNAHAQRLAAAAIESTQLPIGLSAPTASIAPMELPAFALPTDALATRSVAFTQPANAAAINTLTFSVYSSVQEAHQAFEAAPQILLRAGWQSRAPTGIRNNAHCLTLQSADRSEAICYVSRDDVIVTAYSMLPLPAIDAVYLNANDLARFGSDIYDQVERP